MCIFVYCLVSYKARVANDYMRVLVACEYSGKVRDAFIKLGHDAISCDILPTDNPGPHYQGDVFNIINDGFDMMIAFPPCTYLTNAGIRWFNVDRYGAKAIKRHENRLEAMEFVSKLYNSRIDKICIENPIGYLNKNFRSPDQIVHPYFFGDSHVKPTCLFLKNLPLLVRHKGTVKPEPLLIQQRRPGKYYKGGEEKKHYFTGAFLRDSHSRSKTFQGIADAMASQWGTSNVNPIQQTLFKALTY